MIEAISNRPRGLFPRTMQSFERYYEMVTRLLTLLSLLTLIGSLPLLAAEETYDLRGPAPKKGLVTADVVKFTMNKADISIDLGDNKKLTGKMDMTSITEKEEEVLAVEGRQITKNAHQDSEGRQRSQIDDQWGKAGGKG